MAWVPNFAAVAPPLARTDLIATLPMMVMVGRLERFGLRVLRAPIQIQPPRYWPMPKRRCRDDWVVIVQLVLRAHINPRYAEAFNRESVVVDCSGRPSGSCVAHSPAGYRLELDVDLPCLPCLTRLSAAPVRLWSAIRSRDARRQLAQAGR